MPSSVAGDDTHFARRRPTDLTRLLSQLGDGSRVQNPSQISPSAPFACGIMRRCEAFRRIESTVNRLLKTLKKLTAWRFGEKLGPSKKDWPFQRTGREEASG
jgi:hypothetical protein